ncbi:RmlC-like cupin domain-containing protein [Rhexocercosporidium sp. MPI-PUGE-AT-0058]|nr:RmlC-like cupin domain-containing protein [Rhexocercosporidium sp. MPI-PUGE-AT-0058]
MSALKPSFPPSTSPSPPKEESLSLKSLIKALNLIPHIEGGYYAETDRAKENIPSPFASKISSTTTGLVPGRPGFDPSLRSLSTTIFYLLTPSGPQGGFHRNASRTVHTLHRGRGRYVIIHADEEGKEKRVESFVVGHDVEKGEKLQWIVDGGKFKASYLLPDEEGGSESRGLLISETVVPGFEFVDHDFLAPEGLVDLLGEKKAGELSWLLSPLGKK